MSASGTRFTVGNPSFFQSRFHALQFPVQKRNSLTVHLPFDIAFFNILTDIGAADIPSVTLDLFDHLYLITEFVSIL